MMSPCLAGSAGRGGCGTSLAAGDNPADAPPGFVSHPLLCPLCPLLSLLKRCCDISSQHPAPALSLNGNYGE